MANSVEFSPPGGTGGAIDCVVVSATAPAGWARDGGPPKNASMSVS